LFAITLWTNQNAKAVTTTIGRNQLGFTISVTNGEPRQAYNFETSTNLQNWDVSSVIEANQNGQIFFWLTAETEPHCFFRFRETPPATLAVSVSPTSPTPKIAIAGSSSVLTGVFRLTTGGQKFTVGKLKLRFPTSSFSPSISMVRLDLNGQTATASVIQSEYSGAEWVATFNDLGFSIPRNSSADLKVLVDIPTTTYGVQSGTSIQTVLMSESFVATDETWHVHNSIIPADIKTDWNIVIRKSFPTITAGDGFGTLVVGNDRTVGKFVITANPTGDIGWKRIVLSVQKTETVSLNGFALWNNTTGTRVTGQFLTSPNSDSFDNTSGGNLVFTADSEQVVAMGEGQNYELRANVGNLAPPYSFVVVSLLAKSSWFDTGRFSDFGNAYGAMIWNSLVWTDRSSISEIHSENSSDWTHDYLVPNLPTTIGGYSASF